VLDGALNIEKTPEFWSLAQRSLISGAGASSDVASVAGGSRAADELGERPEACSVGGGCSKLLGRGVEAFNGGISCEVTGVSPGGASSYTNTY
jgi:hypothetical protein